MADQPPRPTDMSEAIAQHRQGDLTAAEGAHHNRANLLAGLQRRTEAIAGYEQAVALQPDYASAHRALAAMYAEDNRLEAGVPVPGLLVAARKR